MCAAGEMSVNQTWFWHQCSTEVDRGQNSECRPLDLLLRIDTCLCKHISIGLHLHIKTDSNSSWFYSYVISTHVHARVLCAPSAPFDLVRILDAASVYHQRYEISQQACHWIFSCAPVALFGPIRRNPLLTGRRLEGRLQ